MNLFALKCHLKYLNPSRIQQLFQAIRVRETTGLVGLRKLSIDLFGLFGLQEWHAVTSIAPIIVTSQQVVFKWLEMV